MDWFYEAHLIENGRLMGGLLLAALGGAALLFIAAKGRRFLGNFHNPLDPD